MKPKPKTDKTSKLSKFPVIALERKKKRRNYDTGLLAVAYKAVREDGLSVRKAAKTFGIPESTLRDRHLGMQPVGEIRSHGPPPLLSKEEEKNIVNHFTDILNNGYSFSKTDLLEMATEYAILLGKKSPFVPAFNNSWLRAFKKRWPCFEYPKNERQSTAKAKAISSESLGKHYTELGEIYRQLDLNEHPERVWNVDEADLLFESFDTTLQTAMSSSDEEEKCVTLIGCANAASSYIPPYYIFPGKRWSKDLLLNTCPGTAGEMSVTDTSNSLYFKNYLEKHFLKFVDITEGECHLIILDCHKSHVTLKLVNWGKAHGIVFYFLPPYSSHVTQPLEVQCLVSLKAMYSKACQTYLEENFVYRIDKKIVAQLSSKAYMKAFGSSNISKAFSKTKLFPLYKVKPGDCRIETATVSEDSDSDENEDDWTLTDEAMDVNDVARCTNSQQLHIETPTVHSAPISKLAGFDVYLKLDNLQIPGSFKIRGIGNLCKKTVEKGCKKIVCASGGNAGLAAAYAAQQLGIEALIVLPQSTPAFVADKLRDQFGATVLIHGKVWDDSNKHAQQLATDPDCEYVHPFDHPDIWEGHMSMIEEAAQQLPCVPDVLLVSVGGGGLLNGVIKGMWKVGWSDVPCVAMETVGADCLNAALKAGQIVTLPDITSVAKSLGSKTPSTKTVELANQHKNFHSVVVTDKQAVDACLRFADDHRMLVEPACGASLAGVYSGVIRDLQNQGKLGPVQTAVVIVCGGSAATIDQLQTWQKQVGL